MAKEIPLTNGGVTIVDDDWFEELSTWTWHLQNGGRVAGSKTVSSGIRIMAYIHCWIMRPPFGMEVDHKNRNPLDNRTENLRVVSRQDNAKNKGKAKRQGITSQFKGVSLIKSTGAWRATITIDGKNTNLGHYATERDAAIAYDIAAVKYHGEFAALNFPETASENEPPKVFVSPRGKSQYMGVTWYDRYGKWLARIGKGNQRRFLGYFDLENEAARAYNAAALELYGHRARLNEIFETEAV